MICSKRRVIHSDKAGEAAWRKVASKRDFEWQTVTSRDGRGRFKGGWNILGEETISTRLGGRLQGRGKKEEGASTETPPQPIMAALSAKLRTRQCVGLGAGLLDDSQEGRIEGGQDAG